MPKPQPTPHPDLPGLEIPVLARLVHNKVDNTFTLRPALPTTTGDQWIDSKQAAGIIGIKWPSTTASDYLHKLRSSGAVQVRVTRGPRKPEILLSSLQQFLIESRDPEYWDKHPTVAASFRHTRR